LHTHLREQALNEREREKEREASKQRENKLNCFKTNNQNDEVKNMTLNETDFDKD
jgi:hypothetical protein